MTSQMPNKGQVVTQAQLELVARRLFETIDMDNKKALNKVECEEFFDFIRDTVYHKPIYVPKSEIIQFEARWDTLKKVYVESLKALDGDEKKLTKIAELRVTFEAIWEVLLAESKADGCLFIPFEETSASVKQVPTPEHSTQNQKIIAHLNSSK